MGEGERRREFGGRGMGKGGVGRDVRRMGRLADEGAIRLLEWAAIEK